MVDALGRLRAPGHRRPPTWVGDVVAGALVVGAAFAPFPEAEFRPGSALAIVLVIAPAFVLPFRRRWPISVLAVIIGLYGAAALVGTLSAGNAIAAAVAMFRVATRSTRRVTFVVAAIAVVGLVLLSLLATVGSVFDARALQFAITIAFAAAAGDATRSRREYITAVTERAERAERTHEAEASRRVAEERLRIARDLHDAVAHQISVISLNAGVATSALETRPEKAREALGTIRQASRTVLGEIGNLLEVLRADDDVERAKVPQPGLDRFDDLVADFARVGLAVQTRVEGDLRRVDGAAGLVAYRVIQEGLTNAQKHGAEHRAHVLVDVGETTVTVVVVNPVRTARADAAGDDDRARGHGLLGIRERVASVRGTVEAGMTVGGWRVAATLPLTRKETS
ncbi:sensor histidine kinase [Microbacterium sp. P06]|uniref:sensor histidine kinase n=1 Tax=unclassified Microbacterium TaxID=2609290 RepID=UPI0037466788